MRANERALLTECIENGLQYGMMKAYKHTDNPGHDYIIDQMENAIWYEIDQYFVFDNEQEPDEPEWKNT